MIMIKVYKALTKYFRSSVRKDTVHTTPHTLYIYNYILLLHSNHTISTYIHTHIGGKYVYDCFIDSHCKPDFG